MSTIVVPEIPDHIPNATPEQRREYNIASRARQAAKDALMNEWAKSEGVKPAGGRMCLRRLFDGLRCLSGYPSTKYNGYNCPLHRPPHADHSTLWSKDGKPEIFVTQPYPMTYEALRDIVEFCETHGLEVDIDTWPAWHYPGHVLMLEYRVRKSR